MREREREGKGDWEERTTHDIMTELQLVSSILSESCSFVARG